MVHVNMFLDNLRNQKNWKLTRSVYSKMESFNFETLHSYLQIGKMLISFTPFLEHIQYQIQIERVKLYMVKRICLQIEIANTRPVSDDTLAVSQMCSILHAKTTCTKLSSSLTYACNEHVKTTVLSKYCNQPLCLSVEQISQTPRNSTTSEISCVK